MLTSASRSARTLFLLAISALFFGLVVPIVPASAAGGTQIVVTGSISGTATVGSTLTANPTFTPSNGASAANYKWQSVDSGSVVTDIPGAAGATASTYVPTGDMIGKRIQVVVTSNSPGQNTAGTGTLGPTAVIGKGNFTTQPSVTISDTTPQVDQTVTANVTGTVPSASVTYAYQWYTVTGAGGPEVLVAGATNPTFTAADTDLGKKLLVKVIASKADYNNSNEVSSAQTTAVANATFTTPPTVTIDNTSPKVNETINAIVTGTSPSGGVTYAYQWYSASPSALISGATGSSYTVTGADLGKKLQVKVVASKPGYTSTTEVSSALTNTVAPADFTSPPTVTIDNTTPTFGDTLTASGTDAVPSAGTTYTYQWYTVTGGNAPVAINGATATTYQVAAGDVGKKIVVKKTANKTGYTSTTATSAETSAVLAANFTTPVTVTIDDNTPVVDETLTATATGEVPASTSYTYQWYQKDGGVETAISGATGSTYVVEAATVNDTIFVRVHAKKAGFNDSIGNSAETGTVIKANFSTGPQVSVSDLSPQVDQEVSAVLDTAAIPAAGSYAYQWYTISGTDSAVEIAGATADKYTATVDDLGLKLQVRVTAQKPGYDDAPDTSDATAGVAKADFSTDPAVSIDNTSPAVGDEVSAVLDTPAAPTPDSYAYQWYTVDGTDAAVPISGATGDKFTVTGDEADLALQVKVTASRTGYNDASGTSAETNDVTKINFTSGPVVTIDNSSPKVDDELTATVDTDSDPVGTYAFQWYSDDGVNPPVAITGATDDKYTVAAGDVDLTLSVKVTASKKGYNDASDTSDATSAVVKASFSGTLVAAITGTPKVGVQLTAGGSGLSPTPGGYTYQWKANDVDIASATSSTFTPTVAEQGDTITVTLTATKPGYNDSAADTSDATSAVAKGDITGDLNVVIDDTTPTEGQLLTVTADGGVPTPDGYTFQWKAAGANVATGSTFTPTAAEIGKQITVEATATKVGYNAATDTSLPTAAVAAAAPLVFNPGPTASLSTTAPKVGDALKVTPTGTAPAPDSYAYQWYKVSLLGVKTPIVGEIGSTYNVPFGALNYKLQAKVTAVKSGYTSSSASSVQTARVNQIILDKASVTRGQLLKITAKKMRAGQVYRMFIDGVTVYKGNASSTGNAIRTVTVPKSISAGTKKVWVSGYNSAGDRDFQVVTTVIVK